MPYRTAPIDIRHARLLLAMVVLLAGCSGKGVKLRSVPRNPLTDQLNLASYWGPTSSERTQQVLRVWNLEDDMGGDPRRLLEKLQAAISIQPTAEKVYAFSEVAYIEAKRVEGDDPKLALDLYGASVLYAYNYLFDDRFARLRNPYDPQFRGACDLYNSALEGAIRLACREKQFAPGKTRTIETAAGSWDVTVVLRGNAWRAEDIDYFEFVSDYEIKGLKNHYRSHGLGVPLIAVRRSHPGEPAAARYYPPGLSFPVTAFLRPVPDGTSCTDHDHRRRQCLLEIYDPLETTDIPVANRLVSLESDLTTPLAYFLSRPELESLATVGLLQPEMLQKMRPDRPAPIMGLYMAQPYESGKIPVVLVHGLWSSPMTWMETFNDLRSTPEIRDHYQFWFYLYPTGQPFWISAAQMRRDLAEARRVLDPGRAQPALDQMVLVGHSMGGLVAKLQTISSRNDYWNLVSHVAPGQIVAEPDVRQRLDETFFFLPNPSIRRVVTIGTPHRGSRFSNWTTQWLVDRVIELPQRLVNSQERLFRENEGRFGDGSLLHVSTSVDSLSPDCPIFPAMAASARPPWVKYHTIIGDVPPESWFTSLIAGGDGVVSRESARLQDATSELLVPANHSEVQSHPASVLEIRRILLEHLADLRSGPLLDDRVRHANRAK